MQLLPVFKKACRGLRQHGGTSALPRPKYAGTRGGVSAGKGSHDNEGRRVVGVTGESESH